MIPRALAGLLIAGLLLTAAACEVQDGGAVEIAWVIRGTDFHAYACNAQELGSDAIRTIRLSIQPVASPGTDYCTDGTVSNCDFTCDSNRAGDTLRGVTSFTIPEGSCHIGVTLLNAQGNVIPGHRVQVPEPMRKTIEKGNLTFLGVWQFVINLEAAEAGSTP
ncbi:hypothetical protein KKD52_13440 [Myxococcota bacterium]|nr:hypothetical protein [Myxococcota bacterium]MBU1413778.1 hypothetical protein [Myxococcota bacterium]MBU1511358.1 hypothetical protein [Myxococcota bacterium]